MAFPAIWFSKFKGDCVITGFCMMGSQQRERDSSSEAPSLGSQEEHKLLDAAWTFGSCLQLLADRFLLDISEGKGALIQISRWLGNTTVKMKRKH